MGKHPENFMRMGYRGMATYRYLSPEWIAFNALYCDAYNHIMREEGVEQAERIKRACEKEFGRGTDKGEAPSIFGRA